MTANLPAKIEPIPQIDRTSPGRTIGKLPLWLARSAGAVSGDFRNWTIPGELALTAVERGHVEAHVRELDLATRAGPDERVGSALQKLLATFPAQSIDAETAEARAGAYRLALDGFPAWSVEQAIAWWLQRRHGEPRDNYAFAPAAPQLNRLADMAVQPMRTQLAQMRHLLAAKVERSPSQEERDRNVVRFEALLKGLNPEGRAQ